MDTLLRTIEQKKLNDYDVNSTTYNERLPPYFNMRFRLIQPFINRRGTAMDVNGILTTSISLPIAILTFSSWQ